MLILIPKSLPKGSYDIEIFPAHSCYEGSVGYTEDINTFLRQLFSIGRDGRKPSPLEISEYTTEKVDTRTAVQAKFRLSRAGRESGVSFEEAAEEFCKRMFHKDTHSIIGILTSKDILGISAISGIFKTYWTRAVYSSCLKNGPELFKSMNPDLPKERSNLPHWALWLSFACLITGPNFPGISGLIGLQGTPSISSISPISSEYWGATVSAAVRFLKGHTERTPTVSADIHQREWRERRDKFRRCMNRVSDKIDELKKNGGLEGGGLSAFHSYGYRTSYREALCDAVYEATVSAAEIFVINNDMLDLFIRLKDISGFLALSSAVEAVASLSLLCSSVRITHTTTILPLRQWGLREILKSTQGDIPAETNMSFNISNWYGFAAGAGTLVWSTCNAIDRFYKRKDAAKHIKYHEGMIENITASWNIAHKILTLLHLIQCTDAQNVVEVSFVDTRAQAWWKDYVTEVKRVANEETPSEEEFGANAVLLYLDEQRLKWEEYQSQFSALEC